MLSEKRPIFKHIEWYFIHKENTNDNELKDKQTIFPNKIFDAILNIGM
jgi:hypothetical protein